MQKRTDTYGYSAEIDEGNRMDTHTRNGSLIDCTHEARE